MTKFNYAAKSEWTTIVFEFSLPSYCFGKRNMELAMFDRSSRWASAGTAFVVKVQGVAGWCIWRILFCF